MAALVGTTTPLSNVTELGEGLIEKLAAGGISTVEALADMTPEQLEEIPGIGPKTVEKISLAVNNYFASLESAETAPAASDAAAVEAAAVEIAEQDAASLDPATLDTTESSGLDAAATTDTALPGVKPEISDLDEAIATGQALEADAIEGVENAPDADVAEVHTHGEPDPAPEEVVEPEEK